MPGEENLGELESMLGSTDEGQGEQLTQGFRDDNGQGERLLQTSQGKETQGQGEKLLAGKYKSPQELEKGYLSQNKGYRQLESRSKQLESLIQNPKFQSWAANDPDVKEALAKLGYELQQEETREDERAAGGAWDGNMNDPRFIAEVVRQENRLAWDQLRFEKKLGRDLSDQEVRSIKQQIVMAPRLSFEQAWKLTPNYEKEVQAKHEKELAAAQRKAGVNRPKPVVPGTLAGQKPQGGRNVLGLKDDQKRDVISQLVEEAERSGQ